MKIEIETTPTPADEQVVWRGLRQHNEEHVSGAVDTIFAVFLRDRDGAVYGGILAKAGRGWLHINTLWVDPSVRALGYGTQLMASAEAEALRCGYHSAYLEPSAFKRGPSMSDAGMYYWVRWKIFRQGINASLCARRYDGDRGSRN